MKYIKILAITISIYVLTSAPAYASWGWEPTDDPNPYYYQKWGKWYTYDEANIFMVQIDDKTYKYEFDKKGNFVGGWLTFMPMRLP